MVVSLGFGGDDACTSGLKGTWSFATFLFATYTCSLPDLFATYPFATYTRLLPSVFATRIFRYPDFFKQTLGKQ